MNLPFCGQELVSIEAGIRHKVLAVSGTYRGGVAGEPRTIRVQVAPPVPGHKSWGWCDIGLFYDGWRDVVGPPGAMGC